MAPDRLKDETYLNWLGDTLCLQYLKEALVDFSDNRAVEFHNFLHKTVPQPYSSHGPVLSSYSLPQCTFYICSQCTSSNVQKHKNKWRVKCYSKVCSTWFKILLTCHVDVGNPHSHIAVNNFNPCLWPTHPWEVAKVYQPFGCDSHTGAKDADAMALLTFLKNCQHNRRFVTNTRLIEEVLAIRHKLMHSSSMRVEEDQLQHDTGKLIELLEGLIDLSTAEMDSVRTAVEKIKKVQSKTIEITLNKEVCALNSRMLALETHQGDLQARITSLEQAVQDSNEMSEELKTLRKDFQRTKADMAKAPNAAREITDTDITAVQVFLKDHYRATCLTVPNPVVPEEIGLDHVYVEPDIKVLRETTDPSSGLVNVQDQGTQANVFQCKRLFYTKGYKCKQIYITGAAGIGKSTFCKHLVNLWCKAHSGIMTNAASDSDSGGSDTGDLHCPSSSQQQEFEEKPSEDRKLVEGEEDRTVMSDFKLLFYITLRDFSNEYHISDMIDSQILQHIENTQHLMASALLKSVCCLVIVDGLDEWVCPENAKVPHFVNPGIPGRSWLNKNNVFLTTTRSWKFDVLELTSSEVDKHVELSGFNIRSSKKLCSKIINLLNKIETIKRTKWEVWTDLNEKGLTHFHNVPVILTQLICLWFDKQCLGQSQVQLFCSVLEMLLKRAVKNLTEKASAATPKAEHRETLLSKCFSDLPHCQTHQHLLWSLCKVAFEALLDQKRENALVFESSQLNIYNVDQTSIDLCLKSGILSQNKVIGKWSRSEKKLSFLHKKVQEFLAALYITICEDVVSVNSRLQKFCSTVETVLEMSQVWMFMSGIRPGLSRQLLTELMTHVVFTDRRLQQERQTWTPPILACSIQTCVVDCFVEARRNAHCDFSLILEDFYITKSNTSECLETLLALDTSAVKSLYLDTRDMAGDALQTVQDILDKFQGSRCLEKLSIEDPFSTITNMSPLCQILINNNNNLTCLQLRNITLTAKLSAAVCDASKHVMALNLRYVELTHEQRKRLLLSLSQTDNIRQIGLRYLYCTDHGRQCVPVINLYGHTKIQELRLVNMHIVELPAVADCVVDVTLWGVTVAERKLLEFIGKLSSTSHRVSVRLDWVTVTEVSEDPTQLTYLRYNDKLVVTRFEYCDRSYTWTVHFHTALNNPLMRHMGGFQKHEAKV